MSGDIASVCLGWSHYDDAVYSWLNQNSDRVMAWLGIQFADIRGFAGMSGYDYWELIPWFVHHGCSVVPYAEEDSGEVNYIIEYDDCPSVLIEAFEETLSQGDKA